VQNAHVTTLGGEVVQPATHAPNPQFLDMCIRPSANDIGLKHGMKNREAQKLKMDKDTLRQSHAERVCATPGGDAGPAV